MAKGKGKPNSAEKVNSQSVVLKERQTVSVTGRTATSSGRKEAARGGAEPPGWKLQENIESGVAEETMSATGEAREGDRRARQVANRG